MENKGLHNKYILTRTDGSEMNPDNEYFVLKVKGEGNPEHIRASRKAILMYAACINDCLPELAEEIRRKYS